MNSPTPFVGLDRPGPVARMETGELRDDALPPAFALSPSPIRRLLTLSQRPEIVPFALGGPEPVWYPADQLADIAAEVIRDGACLSYGISEGLRDLRAWIADHLRDRGLTIAPEQVLITNGSQHGLQVAMRICSGSDAAIGLEEPTFPGARQAAELTGADIHPVPLGAGRLADLDHLAWLRRHRQVRSLWTMPTARNPSGVTLSPAERILLGETSGRLGVRLIEDDPYHDLWFTGAPHSSLAAVAPGTILIGSFSKILAPGLRLGWMVVPRDLVGPATVAIQASCLVANQIAQQVVWTWLSRGLLACHLERLRAGYRARRDALLACVREFGPDLRLSSIPDGGFFLWVGLPSGLCGERVAELALEEQVSVIPGSAFHRPGGLDDHLRLSFSRVDAGSAQEGVRRLRRALDRAIAERTPEVPDVAHVPLPHHR
jgi:2-aminoadipate transaminase